MVWALISEGAPETQASSTLSGCEKDVLGGKDWKGFRTRGQRGKKGEKDPGKSHLSSLRLKQKEEKRGERHQLSQAR